MSTNNSRFVSPPYTLNLCGEFKMKNGRDGQMAGKCSIVQAKLSYVLCMYGM